MTGGSTAAYVHATSVAYCSSGQIELDLEKDETLSTSAPIFVMKYEEGSIGQKLTASNISKNIITIGDSKGYTGQVFVDYYVEKSAAATELQIDAENFAGYYYVEASTLFRRESDGKDLPAEIVFPKVKIQSNFTFSMAATGEPSTFTFTMDAMPGYTMFNKNKKVLCAMQVINDTIKDGARVAVTKKGDYVDTDITGADSFLSRESTSGS